MAQDLPPGFQLDNGPAVAPPPRAPGIIQGRPKQPEPVAPPAPSTVYRTLSEEEAVARGLAPGGVYQESGTGSIKTVQAAPTFKQGNAIPANVATPIKESVTQFVDLTRALNTFQDDYAGNTITGELENKANAYLGLGTPGQSEWWANFRATDNLIRNTLFGASLTAGEKEAYNQTTISPGMTPEKVRANLKRRADIIRGALERDKEFQIANGYKPEAIEALFAPLNQGGGSTDQDYSQYKSGVEALQAAFDNGASRDELFALAEQRGVNFPDPARVDAMIDFRDKGGSGASFISRSQDELRQQQQAAGGEDLLASETFGNFGRAGNVFRNVSGEAATLGLSDELAGVGGALRAALTGEDIGAGYTAARERQLARTAQAEQEMGPVGTVATQLLTGGAGGKVVQGVRAVLPTARRIAATGAPVTRNALQGAMTRRAGAAGATIGGLAGAAQGDTLQERGTNALIGGGLGYTLGAGGQAIGNRLANRAAPVAGQGAQVQQAADELGIDVIPAVTGGTTTRMLTSGAKQGFISARPIDKAVERMEGQAATARTGASQAAGQAVDDETAGELVRQGSKVYAQRTSRIGGQLYDRADRRANGVSFPLSNAVRTARQELNDLVQAPGGAETPMAKELRDLIGQMGGRTVDVQGVRALKTRLRNEIMQRGLRGSPQDRIYQNVVKAAEDDLISGLQAAGRTDAVQALKTANAFWKNRVETIDQVLDPLIGKNAPRSGEQILASLERMAKPDSGNAANLRRLMQAMPKDEADAVRATVINRLGRPTAGSANADREGFSFDTFLTNWNNMTPSARETMFPPESRDALNKLATVSEAVKRAGSSANRSNTAGAIGVQSALSLVGYWTLEPFQLGAGLLTQYAAGRLLASPKFARLLANAPRQATPAARRAFTNRLGNLAQSEPTLAREIGIYQQALAANDNNLVGSVAAENENQQPPN